MALSNLPGVDVTVKDGALASAAGLGTDRCAVVGVCASGSANTVYEFTDLQTLRDTLGTSVSGGPAVELAAYNELTPTEDRREGVAAWGEKRKAQWKGR